MSKHSTHILVTHPYLTPLRFAQRLTSKQYEEAMELFGEGLEYTEFAVAPYSQKLQRKLKAHAAAGNWYLDTNAA
jgi:hypothetical protein